MQSFVVEFVASELITTAVAQFHVLQRQHVYAVPAAFQDTTGVEYILFCDCTDGKHLWNTVVLGWAPGNSSKSGVPRTVTY
jgi:hypothetical protein